MLKHTLFAACTLAAVVLGYVAQAQATAPGSNGRIVFRRYSDAAEAGTRSDFACPPHRRTGVSRMS